MATIIVLHLHHVTKFFGKRNRKGAASIDEDVTSPTLQSVSNGSTKPQNDLYNNNRNEENENNLSSQKQSYSDGGNLSFAAYFEWVQKKKAVKSKEKLKKEKWSRIATTVDHVLLVIF